LAAVVIGSSSTVIGANQYQPIFVFERASANHAAYNDSHTLVDNLDGGDVLWYLRMESSGVPH